MAAADRHGGGGDRNIMGIKSGGINNGKRHQRSENENGGMAAWRSSAKIIKSAAAALAAKTRKMAAA